MYKQSFDTAYIIFKEALLYNKCFAFISVLRSQKDANFILLFLFGKVQKKVDQVTLPAYNY